MNKFKLDKIMAFLASGLLGYYLGLSIFREPLRLLLLWTLPPINTRHLPKFYPGIMGAIIAMALGYLLYSYFIEKRSLAHNKVNYSVAVALLIILPLLTMGAFRIHAVSHVSQVESTAPTSVRMSLESREIMFATGANSATGSRKYLALSNPEALATIGNLIREMEFLQMASPPDSPWETPQTLWLTYDANGKWYSKILRFGGEYFSESIGRSQHAYYQSAQLGEVLANLAAETTKITNYSRAKLTNSKTSGSSTNEALAEFVGEDFEIIISLVREENKITPAADLIERFEDILENWVPQGDTDIFALTLHTEPTAEVNLENFMVYDHRTKTLWFEDQFYRIDLLEKLNLANTL